MGEFRTRACLSMFEVLEKVAPTLYSGACSGSWNGDWMCALSRDVWGSWVEEPGPCTPPPLTHTHTSPHPHIHLDMFEHSNLNIHFDFSESKSTEQLQRIGRKLRTYRFGGADSRESPFQWRIIAVLTAFECSKSERGTTCFGRKISIDCDGKRKVDRKEVGGYSGSSWDIWDLAELPTIPWHRHRQTYYRYYPANTPTTIIGGLLRWEGEEGGAIREGRIWG
jgi:hypothetical protein